MNVIIWIKNSLILLVSVFFLIIGVYILWGSYHLNNPQEFVMSFFSASLLILICIVGIIYFFCRLFSKKPEEIDNDEK